MSDAYDAIIIGAGHNGLVAAAYLARAGQRVLVLERRDLVGGAAVTEEIHPDFRADTGAHRINRLHPKVARDLRAASGASLRIVRADPSVFSPLPDGGHLLLWRDTREAAEALRQWSSSDAERLSAFTDLVSKCAGFLQSLYDSPPPDIYSKKAGDLWELIRPALRLRRLGKRDMMEVVRVLPMTVKELLDEWFETDVLKGTLGAAGITGIYQGPMAAGTAYLFMHHHVGMTDGALRPAELVHGGMGKLAGALESFARQAGAEIRTNAPVAGITAKDGKVSGVVLENGDEIEAQRVISNADPRRTCLELLDPTELDPSFVRSVRNIRFKGVCAKVILGLGELPNFSSLPGEGPHLGGIISISPSLEYLERAYDEAKHGDFSKEPYLEAVIPSLTDQSLAPFGKHVMSILVQYAPYHLKEGAWDDAKREALGDKVVETLARYAPNIESAIVYRHVLTPLDLEEVFGLTEGNIYHGEMTLDQLFVMRPVPGWSRYRMPVGGLYLCGAGTHPGGGVTGASGYNAAREVLADVKRSK
ncbi:MAG: NAD(P)/FAD-dependent oxidoreductase [Gemmatimonadota bacterium]